MDLSAFILSDLNDDYVNVKNLRETLHISFRSHLSWGSVLPFFHHKFLSMSPLLSSSRPPIHRDFRKSDSILFAIRVIAFIRGSSFELSHIDFDNIDHKLVKYLPSSYLRDKMFELSPLPSESQINLEDARMK